ncbi:MAG: glycosyltransferase family 9 protein [Acidobacteria bacterium]|nr:MAG: glycosyltransferase family 9 protein [Acidobacteriota bacterium]
MASSILIVRLGSLGDLIHTLPAFAALRRRYPEARIDWLVEPPHREILTLVLGLSNVVVLKGRSLGGWFDTIAELRARRYDLALDFQGLIKSATLARLCGAETVIGFSSSSLREPAARLFYSRSVLANDAGHVIDKNLALAGYVLGERLRLREPWDRTEFDFPLADVRSLVLDDLRAQGVGEFALVNPGAAWPNKRWPAERFGAIAKDLADTHGLTPVVLWGPGERVLAETVASASDGRAVIAAETRLPDLVALARAARFAISGDTGPLHIACAAGTPTVSLFGPTDAARNGPWNPRDIVLSRYRLCGCHYKRQCQQPHSWCLPDISVEDVREAIRQRLAK